MERGFQLFPERASTVAGQVDALYVFLTIVGLFFTTLICVSILFLATRYRRAAKRGRRGPTDQVWLEAAWIAVPLLLTMVMFGWGAIVYFDMQTPPSNALRIDVVAKQWMWKVQHGNGRREINELHIPIETPVRLRMISEDVIHSFYVPAFRVKQDVLPGRYTDLWFEATRLGSFHLFCAEYCGTDHAKMGGHVVVLSRGAYSQWLEGTSTETPQVAGRKLFERFRCAGCHRPDESGSGPTLTGLIGQKVQLADGNEITADEQYLRDSILNPQKQILSGYRAVMPTYQGQISESDVLRLIAYLKSLSKTKESEE